MTLVRFLILALAVWLIARTVRRLLAKPQPPSAAEGVKNMVRCAQCGLHLPETEAIPHQSQYYCCKQHLPGVTKQTP